MPKKVTVAAHRNTVRQLVRAIESELMSNNIGEKATRLQLRGRNEEDYGGYCRASVREILTRHLSANTKEQAHGTR